MKKLSFLFLLCLSIQLMAQDAAELMEEGRKLEQKLKDGEALEQYKQALVIEPTNIKLLVKLVEVSCSIGSRQTDVALKGKYFAEAKEFAEAALKSNPSNGDANYAMSLVYGKLTEVEKKKEVMVQYIRQSKAFASNAVGATPSVGKAYNVLGRWHYEMLNANNIKKVALKIVYGSFPESNIDSAISYMEKSKTLEPYYCQNFLDLGKAYNYNRQYEKAIAVLQQLAKLPTKRQDDIDIKKEGAELLQKLQ
jgi:tetratricopeptide (TPR) repeat protein